MTGIVSRLASRLAAVSVSALLLTGNAVANEMMDLNDQLQLNTAITVTGKDVHLGDIFTGYLSRPEKVVAQAPRPGQRMVLSAEWLNSLARTYGLGWRATNGYDRAIVYQPGQAVAPQDILAAVKADLVAKGMPANYTVAPTGQIPTLTVAMAAATDIGVREAFFDPRSRAFSAVVEVPLGAPNAQFVSMRGTAYPVVKVPMLKESAQKNTVITEDMLVMRDIPEDQMRAGFITDPAMLIGKAPKMFVRAGAPIQENDVALMTLVDIPVLTMEMNRDNTISKANVTFATFNAADLPGDVVTDPKQLIGYTPRRFIPAGAPLRRGDVQIVRQIQVPVASRDLNRGEILDSQDIAWISMNDSDIAANTIVDDAELMGRATKHQIRAGSVMRTYDVARPIAVERGQLVTIIWSAPSMSLTAQGKAMETGGVGDAIRVINTKSKTALIAEIIDERTVRLSTQQTASR